MNRKFKESEYYKDWIYKAERDLDTARLNYKHGGYTDVTCYFCHQTAEKVLKSYLLYKKMKYLPRTHILPSLLSLCEEQNKSFSKLKQECQILDQYYIETKYPAVPPIDYPKKEAWEAVEKAKEVLKFVKEKVKS